MKNIAEPTTITSWSPSDEERELVSFIQNRREILKDMRREFETEWDEDEDLYTSETDTIKTEGEQINFNTAFTFVQTKQANELDASPIIKFEPVEPSDIPRAELMQAVFYQMWQNSDSDIEYWKANLSKNVLGTGVMHICWEKITREVYDPKHVDKETGQVDEWKKHRVTIYEDVRNLYVDLRDFFPNLEPNCPSFENMNDCFWRRDITPDNWNAYFKDNPLYKNTEYVRPEGAPEKDKNKEEDAKGSGEGNHYVLWYYWNEARDLHVIVANDVIIFESHLPVHKRLPFAAFVNHMELNSFYGRGEVRIVKKMAEYKNSFTNMLLDQAKYTVYSPMLVPDTIDFTDYPEKNPTWSPGAVWPVNDPSAVQFVKVPPVGGDAYNVITQINQELTVSTAINPQAVMSMPGNETAFEKDIQRESQIQRIKADQKINDMQGLQRVVELDTALIRYFYDQKRAKGMADVGESGYRKIKMYDKKIVNQEGKMKIVDSKGLIDYFEATPEIIRGEIDVRVVPNSTLVASKALQQAKVNEWLQALAPYMNIPEVVQSIDFRTIIEGSAKAIGISPDDLLKKRDEQDPNKENDDIVNGVRVLVEPEEDHELHLITHQELRPALEEELQNAEDMLSLFPDDFDRQKQVVLAQIAIQRLDDHMKDHITEITEATRPPLGQMGEAPEGNRQMATPAVRMPKQNLGQMAGQAVTM